MSQLKVVPTLLAVAIAMASGCSVYKDKRDIENLANQESYTTSHKIARYAESVTDAAKREAQDVNRPFIIGKAIPLAREVTLPLPLRQNVNTTLLYSTDGDLVTLAERIQDATGIPVKVTQDALLPPEAFMPRLEQKDVMNGVYGGAAVKANLAAPVVLNSPLPTSGASNVATVLPPTGAGKPATVAASKISQTGSQPLASTLDSIAIRLGVYWKYEEDIGAIVFYRTETRTFEVRGAESTASSEMSVELTGGVNPDSSSGMESKSKSSLKADEKDSPMVGIMNRVQQFMTRSGRIASGTGGLLVVTDTKSALDKIDDFIKRENTMRTRRIDMVFEEITIEKSTSSQSGMNWDLLFNTDSASVNVSGLNSLLEQEGAALSLGAAVNAGPWKGSSVSVQALAKVGKIVDQKTNSFSSTNGKSATTGRPEKQKYIDKLQQTQSNSDTSKPTVSVTQAEEVSGRILTVLPKAYSDGDIDLDIKFDNTPTPFFEKQVLPDGSYVQSPRSVGDISLSSVTARPGQPIVVFASTSNNSTSNERRTDRNAPIIFGGSDVADKTERLTVFVLTAMVREK